jgi:predicted component of type VI protein secretion system
MRRELFLVAVAACSRAPSEPGLMTTASHPATATPTATATATATPTATSTATPTATSTPTSGAAELPLHWDDPPRWRRLRPSTAMRVAEYAVPRAAGDGEDGNCAVFTFGPDQGGSVDENVDRWVRQFDPVASEPVRRMRQANGMPVTRVEVAGTFHAMQMPGAPAAPSSTPRSRLVGAIVRAPSGLWFFKMTGLDATVKAAGPELDTMIDSVRPR